MYDINAAFNMYMQYCNREYKFQNIPEIFPNQLRRIVFNISSHDIASCGWLHAVEFRFILVQIYKHSMYSCATPFCATWQMHISLSFSCPSFSHQRIYRILHVLWLVLAALSG